MSLLYHTRVSLNSRDVHTLLFPPLHPSLVICYRLLPLPQEKRASWLFPPCALCQWQLIVRFVVR